MGKTTKKRRASFAKRVAAKEFRTGQTARHTERIVPAPLLPRIEKIQETVKEIPCPNTWAIQLQKEGGNLVGIAPMFRPLSEGEIAQKQAAIYAECEAAYKVGGSNPKSLEPQRLQKIPIMRVILQDGYDGEMLAVTIGFGGYKRKCAPSCITYGIANMRSRKVYKTRRYVVRRGMTFAIPDLPIGDLIPGSTRDEKDREAHTLVSLKIRLTEKCGKVIADEVCQLLADAYESI